ncbi:hypothetical protein DICVIV_00180 [Dictyocaulus viviparus]|uniref:Uncharacterized protein n=1 Tax=Dictyocaulus viviparus TaxID=29172 RepID=A0A0D8YGE4_DICVI|nr:hypothetical protein DICVIV_00180 [Dictyocaulus viviparus]
MSLRGTYHNFQLPYFYSTITLFFKSFENVFQSVSGRRRHGYVRGCLSDIHGYNHTLIRSLADHNGCLDTNARQLFLPTALRQELEPSRLAICGCHTNLCNTSTTRRNLWFLILIVIVFSLITVS